MKFGNSILSENKFNLQEDDFSFEDPFSLLSICQQASSILNNISEDLLADSSIESENTFEILRKNEFISLIDLVDDFSVLSCFVLIS